MGEIWAIILAAGESRRMGFPKMLLTFQGISMIEKVIHNVKASNVDKIMVVLGAERDELMDKIKKLNVRHCYNDNYKQGMLSSVKCGLRNLPSGIRAVLIFQGDQPLITPGSVNMVIEAYLSSANGIAIPVYKGKRGHPLLIDNKYVAAIENISTDQGLHSLAADFSGDVLEVETNDPGILRDFDTYQEYLSEINKIK